MEPEESLEELRSLHRRLMSVDGDLVTRLETEIQFRAPGIGGSVRLPSAAEMSRLTIELAAVRAELERACDGAALQLGDDPAVEVSSTDAEEAYASLSRRTRALRRQVRGAFEDLRAAHPALETAAPLADDTPPPELEVGSFGRRYWRVGGAFVMLPLIAFLLYWAWSTSRDDDVEAARKICSTPPPCHGDVMKISAVRPTYDRGRVGPMSFVLHRQSSGCSRVVEAYFSSSGGFMFRGSAEDPDQKRREQFIERRRHHMSDMEVVSSVACSAVDDLL